MKFLFLLSLLTSFLFANSRVENKFICIDDKLFIQTTVWQEYSSVNDWRPISSSLVQVFSQWGSNISITDCKTHGIKSK